MNNEFNDDKENIYNNLTVNTINASTITEYTISQTNYLGTFKDNYCYRIVGYLDAPRIAHWRISSMDDELIYESGDYVKDDVWIFDLNDLSLVPGTELQIDIILPDKVAPGTRTIIYRPDSNATAYFEYFTWYQERYTSFRGTVPIDYSPNAEPYLNCYKISVYNDSGVLTKYALYNLSGTLLYESGNYAAKETWEVPLQEIGLKSGDIFTLKALVYAGEDSTCDATIRYLSDSKYLAYFKLHGTTTKNVLMFEDYMIDGEDTLITVPTSNIVAYNLAGVVANWKLLMLDGTVLYSTSNQLQYDTWKFNLRSLGILEGTLLRLKVAVDARNDHYADEFFQYTPSAPTLYYEYIISGGSGKLYYNGSVPSTNKPPILKCSSISATHSEYPVIMKWEILQAESGNVLLISGRCAKGNTWNFSLKDLNVAVGTRLKLKAFVRAGADSEAYIILEYDPSVGKNARFGFYGNAFKTVIPYRDW